MRSLPPKQLLTHHRSQSCWLLEGKVLLSETPPALACCSLPRAYVCLFLMELRWEKRTSNAIKIHRTCWLENGSIHAK